MKEGIVYAEPSLSDLYYDTCTTRVEPSLGVIILNLVIYVSKVLNHSNGVQNEKDKVANVTTTLIRKFLSLF